MRVGEREAVEVGGPNREFLQLVVKAADNDLEILVRPAGCRLLYPHATGT